MPPYPTGDRPTEPLAARRAEILAHIECDRRALRAAAQQLRAALLAQLHLGHHLARRPTPWLVGGLVAGFTVGLLTRLRPR